MAVTEAVEGALWDEEYSQGRQVFVGLSNQGATCYLNSLLQALFMLPEFCSAVWACDVGSGLDAGFASEPNMSDEELAKARDLLQDSIPRQMQLLFTRLQLSVRRAVSTVNVTRSFGWGNVRSVLALTILASSLSPKVSNNLVASVLQEEAFQQHDVLELFTVLLDALSASAGGCTNGTSTPASLFEFEMTDVLSYVLPDGENIRRGRTVPERHLSLFLDETTTSLEAAIQRYVSAETIEGLQADEAGGARVTAMKALRFGTLPPCLLFNLQRFSFDYERQRRVKVDQHCAFPLTIDMENFLDEDCATSDPTAYALSAVLIHSGTAYSGHYFAYVKDCASGSWFEFNDQKVSLLAEDGPEMDPSFFERVYGGSVSAAGGGSSSMSAYGLVYRRVDAAAASNTISTTAECESHDVPESVPPPADLAAVVSTENSKWEASRAEYIRKRDEVAFEVHSDLLNAEEQEGDSTVTVTLDKTSTLGAALEACLAAIEARCASLQHASACRLRVYDTDSASPKGRALGSTRSQDTNYTITLEELGMWKRTPQHVVLESVGQDGKFPDISPETLTVQVVMYSANASVLPADAFSSPTQVTVLIPAEGDLDITSIADSMSAQLSEAEHSRPNLKLAVVDTSSSRPRLVDDRDAVGAALIAKAELFARDASEVLALYATDILAEPVPEGTLTMQEAFELRASVCLLRVQVIGFGGEGDEAVSEHLLEISRYDIVDQLRNSIVSMANLTVQFIITSLSTGEELKDASASLDDPDLDLTDGVVVSPGIPLSKNQARLKVLQADGKTIGEFIAQPETAVLDLLQSFAHSMGVCDADASADALPSSSYSCIRVRHHRNDDRLGCICSHALSLGESLGVDTLMSRNSPSIVLERLAEPEILEPGAVVVSLRRWMSSSSSLGEPVEVAISPNWEMSDLIDHIEKMYREEQLSDGKILLHGSEPEPEPEPEAQVQVIRPWAYQIKDPSSLHLANWSQPGFTKRALPVATASPARDAAQGDKAEGEPTEASQIAPPPVDIRAQDKQSGWNLNWGDELCWRPRPSNISKQADGDATNTVAVAEKGISIQVQG